MSTEFDSFSAPLAGTEAMPLDFSVMLARSSPTRLGYDRMVTDWMHVSPFDCRRVSSFPIVNGHHHTVLPLASGLKVRSQSESEALHRLPTVATLDDVKRELGNEQKKRIDSVIEEEESDGSDDCSDDVPSLLASTAAESVKMSREKPRKKVSFADDRGHELCTVRIMKEPSDCPPQFSPTLLRSLFGNMAVEESDTQTASWMVGFTQPASEYVKFRDTLEKNNVALENVLVKNEKCKMIGTVKVKNVAFEKQVYIRFTDNNWQSYFDRPSTYQRSAAAHIYDTFCFEIDIPPDDQRRNRIEFCVCFKANGQEFWDSNGGKNYCLLSPELYQRLQSNDQKHKYGQLFGTSPTVQQDAYSMEHRNWPTFASWKNLSNETPYW